MGSVYKRGNIWWVRYSRSGKDFYESSKSRKKTVAARLLKKREGAVAEGREAGASYERVRFEDLARDLVTDYRVNGRRSLQRTEDSLKHLRRHFGELRGPQITTAQVKEYTQTRLDEGAANGTVNRELAALKRMLRLGYQDDRVARIPYVPMLEESNVREGFFEPSEYVELLKALPAYLRPIVTFAYRTGWRKSEVLGLRWERVDLRQRLVTLTPDETKNKTARTIYLDDELLRLLRSQRLRAKDCPFVFHRNGQEIRDFRGAWARACKEAGLPGKMFHDFRRTAVRNLTRSGTQETVAMKFTGHKTRSVFDRYNITDEEDIKRAAERQHAYLSGQSVTKSVTVEENGARDRKDVNAEVVNLARES